MPGFRWNAEDIEFLKKEISAGKFIEDISINGRTTNSIRNQATRLRLIGDGVKRKPWTKMEKALLKSYVQSGWTASEISKATTSISDLRPLARFNRNAIQKQMQRMGLGDKKMSRKLKRVVHFTHEEKIEFRTFLRERYLTMTPEQMAKMWNKSHTTKVGRGRVVSHLVIMQCKLPWKTIIKMPYSRKKRKRRAKSKARA